MPTTSFLYWKGETLLYCSCIKCCNVTCELSEHFLSESEKRKLKKEVPRHTQTKNRIHWYHISRTGVCHHMIQSLYSFTDDFFQLPFTRRHCNVALKANRPSFSLLGNSIRREDHETKEEECSHSKFSPRLHHSFIFTPFLHTIVYHMIMHITLIICSASQMSGHTVFLCCRLMLKISELWKNTYGIIS